MPPEPTSHPPRFRPTVTAAAVDWALFAAAVVRQRPPLARMTHGTRGAVGPCDARRSTERANPLYPIYANLGIPVPRSTGQRGVA
jgi:hypothetical protein